MSGTDNNWREYIPQFKENCMNCMFVNICGSPCNECVDFNKWRDAHE